VDVEAEAIDRVERAQVERALWALPEAQRVAIALMDLGGFTAAEVAQITGSPRGTVLARVHRGRKALARLVQEEASRRGP
jgi:RNA polymerase sigma-70 factor, ECF subfamily